MKKKIFLILAILLCLGAALTLSACSHTHTLIRHAATEPTCAVDGYLEYWECTDCKKLFPDSTAHAELADLSSMAIPALGHDPVNIWKSDETGHWNKCTRTGCTAQVNKTAHTYGEWNETLAPTCVAKGEETRSCTCGAEEKRDVAIDPDAHAPATTWTSDETGHWQDCTRTGCGAQLNKTAHTYGNWVENLAATCVAQGSHYKTCKTCFFKVTEAIPIDASKHVPAATWTTDGTNHWKVCTRTGCTVQLNKTAHTYGNWVETLAATCVAEGSHYKTCKICSFKVTEAIPIDAGNHAPAAAWTTDGTNHWKVCTRTGCTAQLNKGAHTPAWSSNTANHWKDCTACGYDIAPAAAHTYDAENTCVCGDYKDKGVQFTLRSGTYVVTDYTGTATEVVIPATYKGIAVTSIGYQAFSSCSKLTTITIPDSVTSIGEGAFYWCSRLTAVTFGANSKLTSIGERAFYNCSQLTTITIPVSVTSIGYDAFSWCSQLTTVTFGANSKLTSIGDGAFYECTRLTSVTIPDSVTSIGEEAFYWCSRLTTVTFGANSKLTSIGYEAFYHCSQLTTITIPAGVTSIGNYAFYYCSQLTTVTFGANSKLTSIGNYAFSDCSQLTTITIPDSVTSIGYAAFEDCSQLTTVYYGGSASDWENITIDTTYNYHLTSATRYYYSATQPTTAGNWWYYDQNGKPAVWP